MISQEQSKAFSLACPVFEFCHPPDMYACVLSHFLEHTELTFFLFPLHLVIAWGSQIFDISLVQTLIALEIALTYTSQNVLINC